MRPFSARISLLMMLVAAILPISGMVAFAADNLLGEEAIAVTPPDSAQAARLLNLEPSLRIIREKGAVPGWAVSAVSAPIGYIVSTWEIAQRLRMPQIEVPFVVQERLWAIKYTLFVAIFALSFYSMEQALILAEVEPFKTAMSMRFLRAWPFVLFIVAILIAGLFIERFYCRYLCPLGAALAIPAKLKLFDRLSRRSQCGRECRLCEHKCIVGAIDPIGRINPNECMLSLRCQMIYHDPKSCTILKRRAARTSRPMPPSPAPPGSPV